MLASQLAPVQVRRDGVGVFSHDRLGSRAGLRLGRIGRLLVLLGGRLVLASLTQDGIIVTSLADVRSSDLVTVLL